MIRPARPRPSIDLLLKAVLLPLDEARNAWRAWVALRDFDAVTADEVRLLAVLSARLGDIDPDSPLRPRISGVARADWTRSQVTLTRSLDAVDSLERAGVPFIVFKGAAHYAEGLARRRVLFDIDVLVRETDLAAAIDALFADGWKGARGESRAFVRAVASARISINLARHPFGDVDLHRSLFHRSFPDRDADAAVWATARRVVLSGHRISVPADEVATLVSLAHGAHSSSGDWVLDLAARLGERPPDWDAFLDLAVRWRLAAPACAGLAYLRQDLGIDVPGSVLTALAAAPVSFAERASHWSHGRQDRRRWFLEQPVGQVADNVLRRRGYRLAASDRTHLTIARPGFRAARAVRKLPARVDPAWGCRHALTWEETGGRDLAAEIEVRLPGPVRQVRFDVMHGDELVAGLQIRLPADFRGGVCRRAFLLALPDQAAGQPLTVSLHERPDHGAAGRSGPGPAFRILRAGAF